MCVSSMKLCATSVNVNELNFTNWVTDTEEMHLFAWKAFSLSPFLSLTHFAFSLSLSLCWFYLFSEMYQRLALNWISDASLLDRQVSKTHLHLKAPCNWKLYPFLLKLNICEQVHHLLTYLLTLLYFLIFNFERNLSFFSSLKFKTFFNNLTLYSSYIFFSF